MRLTLSWGKTGLTVAGGRSGGGRVGRMEGAIRDGHVVVLRVYSLHWEAQQIRG